MWDWGDGTYSDWSRAYNSGETVEASKIWSAKGTFEVRVKARDSEGIDSGWSDSLSVSIPKKKIFLRNMFEEFRVKLLNFLLFLK